MAHKDQVFRFTDACYALETSDERWLQGLAAAAAPLIERGMGVGAWTFSKDEWTRGALPVGIAPELGQAMWSAAPDYSKEQLFDLFMGGRATSATERLGMDRGLDEEPEGKSFAALGMRDVHALTVWDSAGRGVAVVAPAPALVRTTSAQRARLERLGAHLLAGHRLRTALRQVDAVLEPAGRLLHAEGEAREQPYREALMQAVRAFDRARSQRSGDDVDEALSAFEGLVVGRWSIVQSFENDGRRYLVAMQNPPGAVAAAQLSPFEAHALLLRAQGLANKLIAYELGLSEAAVHHLIQRGMGKLGVARETDLPLLFREQLAADLLKAQSDG